MHMNNGVISAGQGRSLRLDVRESHAELLGHGRQSDFPTDAGPDFRGVGTVGHGLEEDFLQLEHGRTRLQGAVREAGRLEKASFRRVGLRTV